MVTELLHLPEMSIPGCIICRELIEIAALRIKQHLESMAALALAVQNDAPDAEITFLKQGSRACSLNRENAVADYDRHVAGHSVKTMTAGSNEN